MTNDRAEAARTAFQDNEGLDSVYVTSDGECFRKQTSASAHAKDIGGSRTDYINVESDDLDVIDDIEAAVTTSAVDDVTAELEDVKGWVQEFADGKKAELDEAERVADKLDYVDGLDGAEDTELLNLLLHGEENQDVIDAINTKLNP